MTYQHLRLPTFAQNNRGYFQLLAALPAAAGSAVSVLLIISACWALISMAVGRFRLRYLPTDYYIVVASLSYVLVMIASIVLRPTNLASFDYTIKPLMYLTPVLIIPRYRAAPEVDYFSVFVRAAPSCGILLLPVMAYQLGVGEGRIAGGAGNPFPFAMICAFFAHVALLNLPSASRGMVFYSIAGFLGCSIGLVLSETRTVWVVFLINLIILAWFLHSKRVLRGLRGIAAVGCIVFLAILSALSPKVEQRISAFAQDVQAEWQGGVASTSMSARLALWSAGIKAVEAHPIIGYGAHQRRSIIEKVDIELPAAPGGQRKTVRLHFNHFHNGFITAMVDAGVFGLVVTVTLLFSPLILAILSPRDRIYEARLAMALFLFVTYAITGSFNIMFGHDLIDAVFVIGLLVIALSISTKPKAGVVPGAKKMARP